MVDHSTALPDSDPTNPMHIAINAFLAKDLDLPTKLAIVGGQWADYADLASRFADELEEGETVISSR